MKRPRIQCLCAVFCTFCLTLSGCSTARPDSAVMALAPAEEERLVVYTSHKEEVYGPIIKEFQERTGIWVEVVTGGTNGLLERVAAESSEPVCDVMFGGGVESLSAYADYFEPYTCSGAELLKPGLRAEDDLWTPFSGNPVVLIYNTKLVEEEELTGWGDLLDQRWRGKIAFADPAVSGSGYTAAVTLLSCLPGEEWALLERFAQQVGNGVLDDSGDVVSAVASGRRSVGVTLEETALKGVAQGADISIVYPVEGTSSVPDGSALIAGAPHPDNARAFLEFVQSVDVQKLVVEDFSRRSVRQDVADREDLPTEGEMGVIDYRVDWASSIKETFLEKWQDYTGEVAQ